MRGSYLGVERRVEDALGVTFLAGALMMLALISAGSTWYWNTAAVVFYMVVARSVQWWALTYGRGPHRWRHACSNCGGVGDTPMLSSIRYDCPSCEGTGVADAAHRGWRNT